MKNISLMVLTLALSVGVMTGCAEKKQPAEKAKEAASQAVESVEKKTAEVKEAAPVAATETKEKAVEKKTAASGPEVKAPEKGATAGKGVEAGAAIFKSKCSPCHGPEGKGTAMAPAFKENKWIKDAATDEIAKVIKNGREGSAKKYANFPISMPANKQMPDSDVNALVDYIKSIN